MKSCSPFVIKDVIGFITRLLAYLATRSPHFECFILSVLYRIAYTAGDDS